MASHVDLDRVALAAARRLRLGLFAQLGLLSPLVLSGCSVSEPDSSEEGGVTTNPSSSGTSASSSTSMGTATSDPDTGESGVMEEGEEGEEGEAETGVKFDLGEKLDAPPQGSCTVEWYFEPEQVAEIFPECTFELPDWVDYVEYAHVCVDKPEGASCADICDPDTGLCEGMESCLWAELHAHCGVMEGELSCCNVFASEPLPPVGRPFLVDAELRLAEPCTNELDAFAAHWYEMARGEHASIAAFARFIASLQRVGAPASLVAEALRAAADEVRHAEDALALAEAFGGRRLGFGPLRIEGVADSSADSLAALVESTIIEGCVGETLAAHEAASLAACVDDPKLAAVLERIAEDELRHAALAWRFVAWAIGEDPSLRTHAREVLARAARELDEPGPHTTIERSGLAQGCPPQGLRARWRASAHRALVAPCAEALLAVS